MAKVRNKRNSGLADKVHNKRKVENNKKKLNPFEVHINKEKIKVLGKKSKHDRGLPGVSRAKAVQKRKETLGTEMKLMNKTNAFIDRRIGEKNNTLSAEDRMVARFAAERSRQHSKKNIYNLADDEILTHRGQTLEQIEKFDDPRSSDEEEDIGKKFGGLDDDFVAEGHFGGGMLSKSDLKDGAKSHKDLIEQLIAESKKRKAEKQKEKEQTLDLTEKLDSEWKDLQPVVFKRARVEEKTEESLIDKVLSAAEKKSEDYDKMTRELRFEKRGTPSDALKSEEKQAKEEKERLAKLEREREQRMWGDENSVNSRVQQTVGKHRSADDLDDNFELDDEKQFMLAYDNDGKPLVPESVLKDFSVPNAKPKFDDGISDTSSESGNSDDESKDSDKEEEIDRNESIKDDKNNKKKVTVSEKTGNECKSSNKDITLNNSNTLENYKDKSILFEDSDDGDKDSTGDESSGNKDDEDDISKHRDKDSDDSDENDVNTKSVVNNTDDQAESSENDSDSDAETDSDDIKDNRDLIGNSNSLKNFKDLKESETESDNEGMSQDEDKIGSFFDMKTAEGDNLNELLGGKTPSQQSTTLQKLIKSYDPSLAENNKDLLSRLFARMLQYLNDIFTNLTEESEIIKSFLIFDKISPYFYDLAHTNKVSSKKFLSELIKEKHEKFKRNPRKMPDLDTLIFFKLISILYPTSDFKHPLTTPSLIFMAEILSLSRFRDAYSISRGFFITSLILEYTSLSKRYVPAAVNFLRGILYLSANTSVLNPLQTIPPFRLHKDAKILNLEDDCSDMEIYPKMAAKDLALTDIDNDFKIRCFFTCLMMLKECFDNYSELEAVKCIFEPHLHLLSRVDLDIYPKKVSKIVSKITQHIKENLEVKTYTLLTREKKKPKALRLYEPDVQEVFTGSKSANLSRENAEKKKLEHKYKKEMKGALREIRRDKSFIASVKIRQKIQSDNIRKDKVKQIYKDAAIQQGELNKLKRT